MTFKLQTTFPIKFPFFTRCCFRCISRFILLEWLLSVVEAAGNAESADILAGRSLKALPALNLWGCVGLLLGLCQGHGCLQNSASSGICTPSKSITCWKALGLFNCPPLTGSLPGWEAVEPQGRMCRETPDLPQDCLSEGYKIEPGYFLMDLLFICFMLLAG